jgi:hypothetical protein
MNSPCVAVLFGFLSLSALACGGAPAHPPVDDGATSLSAENAENRFVPIDDEETTYRPPGKSCEPGEVRDCKIYVQSRNHMDCFPSWQYCRADGFGWQPCGEAQEPPSSSSSESDTEESSEDVKTIYLR